MKGTTMQPFKCPVCDGDGKRKGKDCHACDGRGIVWGPEGDDRRIEYVPVPMPYPVYPTPSWPWQPYQPYVWQGVTVTSTTANPATIKLDGSPAWSDSLKGSTFSGTTAGLMQLVGRADS